jgi:predicted Fe-Mo cluster-binding NifX family protein
MRICIPVNEDKGLASEICEHFGSAPVFLLVDTDTEACEARANAHAPGHNKGTCQPLSAFAGEQLDAVVVGGIGMGALTRLRAVNLEVYQAVLPTVAATLAAFRAGTLKPAQSGCGNGQGQGQGRGGCHGHGRGQGRGHGQGQGRGQRKGRGQSHGRGQGQGQGHGNQGRCGQGDGRRGDRG